MENDPLRVPIGEGAPAELGGMLDEHRDRLKRLVAFRMDRRLAQRVDASDVIQETFAEASRRYP